MPNIGPIDRFLRGVVGAGLVAWALQGHDWAWLGLLIWATAFVEVCPLYALLRISTCPKDKRP